MAYFYQQQTKAYLEIIAIFYWNTYGVYRTVTVKLYRCINGAIDLFHNFIESVT